nr:Rieske (2Fe-2S) protein [Notoacmeibacter sp. MSK16QG-6]
MQDEKRTGRLSAPLDELIPQSWIGRDLPPIIRDGVEYFLLGHKGDLFLVPNRCPHRGGSLKFGYINARDEIVCPMHHNAFSVSRLIARPTTLKLKTATQ